MSDFDRNAAAFPGAAGFWDLQRRLADISWDISRGSLPWPPETSREVLDLAVSVRPRHVAALPYAFRRMGDLLPPGDARLCAFVDAGLLIAAQCTADQAGALYGAAALDRLAHEIKDPNYRIFAEAGQVHAVSAGVHLADADPFVLFQRLLAKSPREVDASHAFYLGYEMAKAATALALGKDYRQDEALSWGFLTVPEVNHRHRAAADATDTSAGDGPVE